MWDMHGCWLASMGLGGCKSVSVLTHTVEHAAKFDDQLGIPLDRNMLSVNETNKENALLAKEFLFCEPWPNAVWKNCILFCDVFSV